jgi:hypothetical protein
MGLSKVKVLEEYRISRDLTFEKEKEKDPQDIHKKI